MPNLILGPIVGGLSDTSVNLWARADGSATLHVWLGHKDDLSDGQMHGTSLLLRPEDGFAGVVPLRNLDPDTSYYYTLRLDETPPPVQKGYPKFNTFPQPEKRVSFRFAFGSCFRPALIDGGKIFSAIDHHRRIGDLRFILLIGDQIYADDWNFNGLWNYGEGRKRVALSLDDYRNVYAYTWSYQPFRKMLTNLPAFMILDDHEVDDDWRWIDAHRQTGNIPIWDKVERFLKGRRLEEWQLPRQRILNALQAYWEHQGMHAPALILPPHIDKEGKYILEKHAPGSLAYSFTYGATAFFVLDTRTMRIKRCLGEKRMLGDGQWHLLKEWLFKVKDKYPVKFIVTSSSILFSMWADIPGDRWSGFPKERDELLRFIGENGIAGVYFLAGDLHSGHAVSAEIGPRGRRLPTWEFCSSPFEQKPFKFAKWLYLPIMSGIAGKQKVLFTVEENHYGIVEVDFSGGNAGVHFSLFGSDGQLLHGPVGD